MSSFLHKGITLVLLVSILVLFFGFVDILVRFKVLETAHTAALKELKENTVHKVITIPVYTKNYEYKEEPKEEFDFSQPF